jgi:TolB protein
MWESQGAVRITSSAATRDGDGGLAWTRDGRIVYVSSPTGTRLLCVIDKDGSNQRRLSVGSYREYYPQVSPDGKYIYYTSDKDTTAHIWRMDVDGGNPMKLSSSEDYHADGTPDGKWVIYSGWATGKEIMYKKPSSGGEPVPILSNPAGNPRVSLDGRLIICNYYNEAEKRWGIGIISFADGALQRYFAPSNTSNEDSFVWSPDGKSLTYVDTENGVSNIWSMPVAGGTPKRLTDFTSDLIFAYAWSADGKYLAVARGEEQRDVVLINSTK